MKTERSTRGLGLLATQWALILLLVVLIGLPVLLILFAALSDVLPRPGNISLTNLTLDTFTSVLNGSTIGAAQTSLLIAFGSSVVALVCGGLLAFLFARTNIKAKPFVYLAGLAPMFIPAFLAALAWSVLASPQSGLINVFARDLGLDPILNIYSIGGMVFVLGVYYAPYVFLFVSSAMALMNPELEEAASVHGARTRTVLRKVTFSLATPALLGSAFLVFILSLENFPVAQFLANPAGIDTLPTYIYRFMSASPQRGNEAAAIAVVLVALVLVLTFIQQYILKRRNYAVVGGKGARPRFISVGSAGPVLLVVVAAYFGLTIILPLVALFVTATYSSPYIPSITQMAQNGEFTLEPLIDPLVENQTLGALANSLIVAIAVGVLGTLIAFLGAYLVQKSKLRGRQLIEYLSMAPLAIPAIVMGMGLLWTWLIMPLPVYGTLLIMVVAFVAVQLPQGYRGMSSSLIQLNPELEEAALMHGANRPRAIGRVTMPLIREGLLSTFILMIMLSLREMTVPLFLYTTDTRLLSILIFDHYENGSVQQAAALGVWYVLLIGILAVLARRFGIKSLN